MICTVYIADLNLRQALLRSIMINGPPSHIQFSWQHRGIVLSTRELAYRLGLSCAMPCMRVLDPSP